MKIPPAPFELPDDKKVEMRRAKRLEWITIAFLVTIVVMVGLTMGSSEAMKAVWAEDILSLVPPIAFLIGAYFLRKPPDDVFPYGYRRAVAVADLAASLALFGFGLFILIEAISTLLMSERPTIQMFTLFGHRIWMGWLMIVVLIYSTLPPLILGHMKLPLARSLHEKSLHTDAKTNKGDWLSGLAAVAGIVGIGFGYWWADAAAAAIISFEILRDGLSNLKSSVAQLMNKRPTDVDSRDGDDMPDRVQEALERLSWVAKARVRLREDGDVLTGEAFVVPRDETNLLDRLREAGDVVTGLEWRLHDVNIVPVQSLE